MQCGPPRTKLRTFMLRALSFSAITALACSPLLSPVIAADYGNPPPVSTDGGMNARPLALGIGKSIVLDLPRDIRDVLVADPKIANTVVRSSQRVYIIGATVGQTSIVFFDADGKQIAAYDVAVTRDLNGIRAALKQILPNSNILVEGLGDGVVLSGSAMNPMEAQQANDLAVRLTGGADKVVNSIVVRGRDQVMLKVTVAEVARSIVKQLGIDLSSRFNIGTSVIDFTNSNPFTAFGRNLVDGNGLGSAVGALSPGSPPFDIPAQKPAIAASLRAMESAGIIRTLAEPNLTALSGEAATFIAGGEFPIPGNYSCDPKTLVCTTSVTYKKFGITLNFTPVVMSEGRISLRVATEVSELSQENALTMMQGGSSITLPSIKTRRADTTLEIPSGGSMAMAGLIQNQTKQAINGLPGMMQLPVLGALFRSRDFVNNQTELMVLVTPYIVHAVAQKDLSRPDDGFAASNDPQAQLLGSLNRIYGAPNRVDPKQNYRGTYGFITD